MKFQFPPSDPLLLMEFLMHLPEEERESILQEVSDRNTDFQDQEMVQSNAQKRSDSSYKTMRARFTRSGGIYKDCSPDTVITAFTYDDTKPMNSMKHLQDLKPSIISELETGTTHYGRYLCGFVAIDDAFFGISSLSVLLEDVTGALVDLAVYNLIDNNAPLHEKQYLAACMFPKGQPVVVYEPFYKVRMDGSLGIRVEQATEIVTWRDVPTDMKTWKKLGNEYFSVLNTQNEGNGALACYQHAMQTMEPETRLLAVLLNNLATCYFKKGDFAISIQLSGAAAHLDPSYFKAWYRFASALCENGSKSIATRVVAHVQHSLFFSPRQLQLLKRTFDAVHVSINTCPFRSYAEWCTDLRSPAFVLATEMVRPGIKDADVWRQKGSGYFSTGDYISAEDCYRKGLASITSCCNNVSSLLNNVAAVYLMMHRETSNVPGISVGEPSLTSATMRSGMSNIELAVLNCTVAGIIDPLNHKAWGRRTRCLRYMGVPLKDCIADLKHVDESVTTQVCTTAKKSMRFHEFKRELSDNIQRLVRCCADVKKAYQVSDVPTEVQRQERNKTYPKNLVAAMRSESAHGYPVDSNGNDKDHDIDEYIARMESLDNTIHFVVAASKSATAARSRLPREVLMYVKHSPPKIHIEFPKLRGWPIGVEPFIAKKNLYRGYLDAKACPWIEAYRMRMGSGFASKNAAELVKRWNGTMALKMLHEKGGSLKYGDIIAWRDELSNAVPAYDARIRSNFANNPNRAEAYFMGTTHVAIGFNDLSSLVTATLRDELHNNMPLRFVGFEMSEFAVAKCKVIAQMLALPQVSIASVMEVWLSSTWGYSTLKDFRKCVKMVLESLQGQNINAKVMSYLNHWVSVETISALKARSEFFSNLLRYAQRVLTDLCSFRREIDRLDLTQYMLTGEIIASSRVMSMVEKEQNAGLSEVGGMKTETTSASKKKRNRKKKKAKQRALSTPACSNVPLVGSLTMWNVPAGAPPLEEDVAFNTVNFMDILEDFKKREKNQKNSTDEFSVVDLFISHIMRNLHRLRKLMVANQLSIEMNYGVVKAVRGEAATDRDNLNLLARIASMRPFTISWSNVLDYFMLEDFHDLARRCSVHGNCVHYGYSMNWTTQVLGASLLDYNSTNNQALIDYVLDMVLGFSSTTGDGDMSMLDVYRGLGLDKLLFLPYRDNPLNTSGYFLANIYSRNWIEYFLEKGQLSAKAAQKLDTWCTSSNCGLQEGAMEPAIPSPLCRTSLTLYELVL